MTPDADVPCDSNNCGCGQDRGPNRRNFLTALGAGSLAILTSKLPVMAGPFTAPDFEKRAPPADKKLDSSWVKSLYDRGNPTLYRGADLRYIGMPVGGIAAGQLYLGGDGGLWHWDIFNQPIATGEGHYCAAADAAGPVGAELLRQGGGRIARPQRRRVRRREFQRPVPNRDGELRGAATARWRSRLRHFPRSSRLNADDSSLPATVLRFTLHNNSKNEVEATLSGKLENAVCLYHRSARGTRHNRRVDADGLTLLECSVEKSSEPAPPTQPDIVFEDWSKDQYDGWTVAGTAFGQGPIKRSAMPAYQGDVGGETDRVVNSHGSAGGQRGSPRQRDRKAGKQAVQDRTQLHPFLDRRRKLQGQDQPEPDRRWKGCKHSDRSKQQCNEIEVV